VGEGVGCGAPRVDLFRGAVSPREPGNSFVILSTEGLPRHAVLLFHLSLVVAAGWLCGDLAVRLVTLRLLGPATTPVASAAVHPPAAPRAARQGYQALVARNLFGALVREVAPGDATSPSASAAASAPVAKSAKELGLTLLGTVVGEARVAYAVIAEKGEQDLYRVGDEVLDGVVLEAVHRGEVVLRRGSERLLLSMQEAPAGVAAGFGKPPIPPLPPTPATPEGAAGAAGEGVRQVSPNSYLLERSTVANSLKNLPTMMRDLRVIPSFDGARQPNGYRVASIRSGSLVDKLGLQRGDVIQSINGLPISDPDRAYQAYQQLKDENSIKIEVLRGTTPQTLTYEIQ